MAGREVQQAHGVRVAREERGTGACGRVRSVADTGGAWQRVEARAREAETSTGAWRRV